MFNKGEIISLTDDNGKPYEFEVLDEVIMDERTFIVLFDLSEESDDTETLILEVKVNNEGEEEVYPINSEEELNQVFDIFKENNKELFEFTE